MATPSDPNTSNSFSHQFQQESSYPEDLRESIISLPKEEGWLVPHMYNYKGFWFDPQFLYGALRCQQHFQAQHSDIILCTLPKCGTTWLKALVFALTTRKQFPVSQQTHPLLTTSPQDLIPYMELSYARQNSPPDFPTMNNGIRVFSTHLPLELLPKSVGESKCKLIYLCRNAKDTFVSFWHFMNKLKGEIGGLGEIPFPEAFDKYCRGASHYGPFWDHILGYWKESLENPSKVLFLKYEEIKKEPEVQLRRIAAFLGSPFSKEEEEGDVVGGISRLCSFESLSNMEVKKTGKGLLFGNSNNGYFRKGKVGDWRNHLTNEMATRLDLIVEETFKGTGLKSINRYPNAIKKENIVSYTAMASPSDPNTSNSFPQNLFQENCWPQELREAIIVSSLPREEGWISPHIYNYKGFWLAPHHLLGVLRSHQHFQAQNSDVILCTPPKCGTTWLKALIFALITRKQFPVSQLETHPFLKTNPQDLIPNLEFCYAREENSPPDFPTVNNNGVMMRIISTHLPLELLPKSVGESKCKLIYLCRDQKDTVVSFWHFTNKLRGEIGGLGEIPFPEAFDKYCRGESLYGPFWDHMLGYWKESLENHGKVLFLKYEEIKEEPNVQLRRMAAFLGSPFSEEEEEGGVVGGISRLCSFESLSNMEVNKTGKGLLFGNSNNGYFRKGNVGDWRNHLTDEMATRLDLIVEETFKGTGLKL
nr:cytosolic sulfotransferase 12-like [Ipomoea batatas]